MILVSRAYYTSNVRDFLRQNNTVILGDLSKNNQFALETTQRNTWVSEIVILKEALVGFEQGTIIFEYTIPRIGKRIDNVLIFNGVCYLIEFKDGETSYPNYAVEQVTDLWCRSCKKRCHVMKVREKIQAKRQPCKRLRHLFKKTPLPR